MYYFYDIIIKYSNNKNKGYMTSKISSFSRTLNSLYGNSFHVQYFNVMDEIYNVVYIVFNGVCLIIPFAETLVHLIHWDYPKI